MATHVVDGSNWNTPAFWTCIVETGDWHGLDLSSLGAGFTVARDELADRITNTDATTVFTVGQSGATGTSATLGSSTRLPLLDSVIANGGQAASSSERGSDVLNFTGPATPVQDGSNPGQDGSLLSYLPIAATNDSPCFTDTTLIKTARGEVPAAQLRIGDMVLTRNQGYQPIRWIGSRRLDAVQLAESPVLNPVLIRAGALGVNTPERDLTVSPQHRMLVGGGRSQLWFGEDEVFVAALHLECLDGVQQIRPEEVTYVHIMFDSHQIISGDGAWSESYQPGDPTLAGVDDDQRAELFAIFPELLDGTGRHTYPAARVTLTRQEVPLLFA